MNLLNLMHQFRIEVAYFIKAQVSVSLFKNCSIGHAFLHLILGTELLGSSVVEFNTEVFQLFSCGILLHVT